MNEIEKIVTLGELDEGTFLVRLQMEFDRAKQAVIEHVALYRGQIRKAESVVTVSISLEWVDKGESGIETAIKVKTPSAPAHRTPVQWKTDTLTGEVNLFTLPPLPPAPAAEPEALLLDEQEDFSESPSLDGLPLLIATGPNAA